MPTVISSAFPVQVYPATGTHRSTPFSLVLAPPEGKQVIRLTSIDANSPVNGVASIGDEWLVDLVTDGGLSIGISANGTYLISNLVGNGQQAFTYQLINNGTLSISGSYTENVSAVDFTTVVSNTFSVQLEPEATQQVIQLTSIDPGSTVNGILDVGDEWVTDLVVQPSGLTVTINADGTYENIDSTGIGDQTFDWFGIDVSNNYSIGTTYEETILDPTLITSAPVITLQPTSGTLTEGSGSVTFSVAATGNPTPTYQWFREGIILPGATDTSLEVYGVNYEYTGNDVNFYVEVTNSAGSVASTTVTLTVNEAPAAPVITQQPVFFQTLVEGVGSVDFTCAAYSLNPLSYQWEVYNGTAFETITGETSATITILGNTVTNAANDGTGYRCRISNTEGTVYTEMGTLFVNNADDPAPSAVLTATEITDSSFNIRFTADEAGTYRFVVLTNNSPEPTIEEVLLGSAQNQVYASPVAVMDSGVEVITPVIGMNIFTPYDVYAVLVDDNDNRRLLNRLDVRTLRDSTAPVIVLNGSRTMFLPEGRVFIDPGAILTDNVDFDRFITGVGTVGTAVGNYTVTYNGSDTQGNAADTVVRNVIVYTPTDDGGIVTDIIDEVLIDVIDDTIE